MRKIRLKSFETNSSSTHTLSIGDEKIEKINLDEDNNLHVYLGKFGWEWATYTNYEDLLSYVLTALRYYSHVNNKNNDILNELIALIKDYYNVNEIIIDNPDGDYYYVDHGNEHIEGMSAPDLFNFIFNQGSVLETGNDNE